MTQEYCKQQLQDCFTLLDAEEYPNLQGYILGLLAQDELDEPMDIATNLRRFDSNRDLPQCVFDLVVELYQSEIDCGNPEAMNDLGALYYDGRGCEQDYGKAVHYYKMAAANGSRQAQENLGYCYYYGRNMPVDYEKAFHYFALGAFDGHLISLYKIGDMYQKGYYVAKNEKEAFTIYERCLNTMTDEAAPVVAGPVFLRLGSCFLNGTGTAVDLERAMVCFQKAELYLYDMVKKGDKMYLGSLNAAISGQNKARKMRMEGLEKERM